MYEAVARDSLCRAARKAVTFVTLPPATLPTHAGTAQAVGAHRYAIAAEGNAEFSLEHLRW
jgi:hypothetical protein